MDKQELKYYLALMLIPNIGNVLAKQLISYCGGIRAVFDQKQRDLERIPDIGPKTARAIVQCETFERAEAELKFIDEEAIRVFTYHDPDYPARLKECKDAPLLFFYKGAADLDPAKVVSIVGTRRATEYGKSFCQEFVRNLARHNVLVVSGLAYGIDACAHRAALDHGLATVGVMGHGLDRVYPYKHRSLADKMHHGGGGMLSEFPSGTAPDRENFPKRNRLIAGLSDAVVVIETGRKGGAMITADIANSYNRDVFALPGKVNDSRSVGCNHLIKSHQAHLIESAEDLEYIMRWEAETNQTPQQKQLAINLNEEEQQVVEVLKEKEAAHIDQICNNTEINMSKTANILLQLEVSGVIKSLPGKKYTLT